MLDPQKMLEISKKVKLPAGTDTETQILKYNTLMAYSKLKDTVTNHFKYTGPDGKKSTSKAGLMIQINKRLKQKYGASVVNIVDHDLLDDLYIMRITTARIIERGEKNNLTRKEIKKRVYENIDDLFDRLT